MFKYNSLGQLEHVFEHGVFEIWFYYDPFGRLVAQKDTRGVLVQYFYADKLHQDRVTHIYNHR